MAVLICRRRRRPARPSVIEPQVRHDGVAGTCHSTLTCAGYGCTIRRFGSSSKGVIQEYIASVRWACGAGASFPVLLDEVGALVTAAPRFGISTTERFSVSRCSGSVGDR